MIHEYAQNINKINQIRQNIKKPNLFGLKCCSANNILLWSNYYVNITHQCKYGILSEYIMLMGIKICVLSIYDRKQCLKMLYDYFSNQLCCFTILYFKNIPYNILNLMS